MAPPSSSLSVRAAAKLAQPGVIKTTASDDGGARMREGDEFWLRVMYTKETQWRFLNSLALHEMSQLERDACADLTSLSTRLEQLQHAHARLTVVVSQCASIRARQQLASETGPALRQLCNRLERLRMETVAQVVHLARDTVVVSESQSQLVACMEAFCQVAAQFEARAKEEGLFSLSKFSFYCVTMPPPPPQSEREHLLHTVEKLRSDLAKHKRRLEKATRKETELETLLLSSEGDIEALRARVAAFQLQREQQHVQSQKFNAALKRQHQSELSELKQSNAQLRSKLEQAPSQTQFQLLENALREKIEELKGLSKQSDKVAEMDDKKSAELKQKGALLLEARQQLLDCEKQLSQYENQLSGMISQSKDETRHFEAIFVERDDQFEELKADHQDQISIATEQQRELKVKLEHTLIELNSRPSVQDYKSLQADLLGMTNDLNAAHQECNQLRAQTESLDERFNTEMELRKETNSQVQKSSAALERLRLEMSQLKNEAESLRHTRNEKDKRIEEQQETIEKSKQLLAKAQSQSSSIKDEHEKSNRAFRDERIELLTQLEEAKALVSGRPDPEKYQNVVAELEEKRTSLENVRSELTSVQQDADASKQISEQQDAVIRDKDSLIQTLEQQLSQVREQMMAMKSQFEAHESASHLEKTELCAKLRMVEDQMRRRPTEEEFLQMKSALEQNLIAFNRLQGEKEKLRGELCLFEKTCEKHQAQLRENQNLLAEAKKELIECEQRSTNQSSRHSVELKRFEDTLVEKDSFISQLKLQLQEHRENLSSTTAAFEKEYEKLQSSLSETREKALLELKGLEECRGRLGSELASMKTRFESTVKQREQLNEELNTARNAISVRDTALASLQKNEEKLQHEAKDLSAKVTLLENKLRESDGLIEEASRTSKKVVQIQTDVHKKEIAQCRRDISGAKSERDMCATLLRRITQRIKKVYVSCPGNEEALSVEIGGNKSVSELQVIANTLIVYIEKRLQNTTHLLSEVEELEAREGNLKNMISCVESEKEKLEKVLAEVLRAENDKNAKIQILSKKLNELERVAIGYKVVSEESEKRLQDQEEAAEVTLTSLAEELRRKEDECEQLRDSRKSAETRVDELFRCLEVKESLEAQISEMHQEHSEKLKNVNLRSEMLVIENAKLGEMLKEKAKAVEEAQASVEAVRFAHSQLQSKCDNLGTERVSLLAAKSSIEIMNDQLETKAKETNENILTLSLALKEKTSLHANAIASREQLVKKLETLKIEVKNLTESKSILELNLSESSKGFDALKEALRESNETLKKAQEDLDIQSSKTEISAAQNRELQASLRLLSEDKLALEAQARQSQEQFEQLSFQRNEAAAKVEELEESLQLKTKLNNSLRESILRMEGELEKMRTMNTTQTETISSLERNLKAKDVEMEIRLSKQTELVEKISNLELDIRNSAVFLEEEKASLQAGIQEEFAERFQNASDEAETKINQLQSEISSLEEKLSLQTAVLATERDDLRRMASHQTAALGDLQEKLNAAIEGQQLSAREKEELEIELEQSRQSLNAKELKLQEFLNVLNAKDREIQEVCEKYDRGSESIQTLRQKLSQSQTFLIESQTRSRGDQSTLMAKLHEAEEKNLELERDLKDSEVGSAKSLAELRQLNAARARSLEDEIRNCHQEIDRLLAVKSDLRGEMSSISQRLHDTEQKFRDLEKCSVEYKDLASKRLAEVEILNSDVIPSLRERVQCREEEVERLSKVLKSKNEEWASANASAIAASELTSRELEEAKEKLHQGKETVLERDGIIEQLRTEQEKTVKHLELVKSKMDEMVSLRREEAEHLQQKIEMYRQEAAECGMRLKSKEAEVVNFEIHLQETREKCVRLENEKEELRSSITESQDSHAELSELQRVHEKLLLKVVRLQRRARRAEMLLQHEKKKHAVIAKKLEVETKRQVSPSTKGLSPAMKRPRAHSLRPPLSPRDGNSRPPMMPKTHLARRSLDFGA
ncbi:unnamed protein product [Agarophyton chilense]